ncbi:hypothetical protein ABK040_003350 [Willaertia magna]
MNNITASLFFLIIFFLSFHITFIYSFEWSSFLGVSSNNNNNGNEIIEKGKNQLMKFQEQSQWSPCWKEQITTLLKDCQELKQNELKRTKLAIHLTNCHLQKSGLSTYKCTNEMSIKECTKDMISSTIAFNTYTEFTTHVDNICYFIQSELIDENLNLLIRNLLNESLQLSQDLNLLNLESKKINLNLITIKENNKDLLDEQLLIKNEFINFKELENEFFKNLQKDFLQISSLSNILNIEMKRILNEQEEQRKYTITFFNEIKDNNKYINEYITINLNLYKEILNTQNNVKESIVMINDKQLKLNNQMDQSLQNQVNLINLQNDLNILQSKLKNLTKKKFNFLKIKSNELKSQLNESLQNQFSLLKNQKESEKYFLNLILQQDNLFKNTEKNLQVLLTYIEDATKYVNKQKEETDKIFTTIEKVLNFNTNLLSEFLDIKSIFYYLITILFTYLLTNTKYTNNARIFIYFIFSLNFIIEKFVIGKLNLNLNDYYFYVNIVRYLSTFLSFLILFLCYYFYKDYNELNYNLLNNMKVELNQLKDLQKATFSELNEFKNNYNSNNYNNNYNDDRNCGMMDHYKIKKGNLMMRTKNVYNVNKSEEKMKQLKQHLKPIPRIVIDTY